MFITIQPCLQFPLEFLKRVWADSTVVENCFAWARAWDQPSTLTKRILTIEPARTANTPHAVKSVPSWTPFHPVLNIWTLQYSSLHKTEKARCISSWAWQHTALIALESRDKGISVNARPWFTQQVPGQPGLHNKTLSISSKIKLL